MEDKILSITDTDRKQQLILQQKLPSEYCRPAIYKGHFSGSLVFFEIGNTRFRRHCFHGQSCCRCAPISKFLITKNRHIRLLPQCFGYSFQQIRFPQIVTVQKEDILSLRRFDAGVSGNTDALIHLMNHSYMGQFPCIAIAKLCRFVDRSVIDQNDLIIYRTAL